MKRFRVVTTHKYYINGTNEMTHDSSFTDDLDELDKSAMIRGMLADKYTDHGPNFNHTFTLVESWSTGVDRKTIRTFTRVA